MGIITMGPPQDIVLYLNETFNVRYFVETGTFEGGTAHWASQFFKKVTTIEYSETYFKKAKERFKDIDNIELVFGDSRNQLPIILEKLNEQALFWLDAHWCSLGSYGENDQCPLIQELELISQSSHNHFVLIDDARLFMAPPPLPNSMQYYPDLIEVVNALTNSKPSYVTIYNDVIISVPDNVRGMFSSFLQEKTTNNQQGYGKQLKSKKSRGVGLLSALLRRVK